MSPETTDDNPTSSIDMEPVLKTEQNLINIIKDVADRRGFTVVEVEPKHKKNFVKAPEAEEEASLCVDGRLIGIRTIKENGDRKTIPVNKKDKVLAPQSPGATSGELDVLRSITGMKEKQARSVVSASYRKTGRKMGAHTAEGHGDMGCGNQEKAAEGEISTAIHVKDEGGEERVKDRQQWILDKGGEYIGLLGAHLEDGVIISTSEGEYFDIHQANEDGETVFVGTLTDFYNLAGTMYDVIQEKEITIDGYDNKEDFQEQMAEAWVDNFLETVVKLDPEENLRTVAVNASSGIEI